ncbi:hypothetical protein HYDPIDRAFT_117010 [Hydnomerulius pinastri MD-312]|uniref:Uncharacterized protein n=1 Tax=Hydnomerulius pinastri MD-312 TaxID=994086 RepID=A0A0C9W326_9AGAM|nr:hypothetical protein HYDPIDRAFT_117010 [Hydnomerulius pinastri MD-312]
MASFRLSAFWSKLEQILLLVKSQSNAGSSSYHDQPDTTSTFNLVLVSWTVQQNHWKLADSMEVMQARESCTNAAGIAIFIMYKLSHVGHMLTTVPLPFFSDTNLNLQTSDDHPV